MSPNSPYETLNIRNNFNNFNNVNANYEHNQIPPYSNLETNLAKLGTDFENIKLIKQLCATIWIKKLGYSRIHLLCCHPIPTPPKHCGTPHTAYLHPKSPHTHTLAKLKSQSHSYVLTLCSRSWHTAAIRLKIKLTG